MQTLPISISTIAFEEIKNILNTKGIPSNYGLRVGSKGSGCSGVSHYLGFDTKKENDEEYKYDNIIIYIQKKDIMHLIGIKLDFIEDEQQRGFVFL